MLWEPPTGQEGGDDRSLGSVTDKGEGNFEGGSIDVSRDGERKSRDKSLQRGPVRRTSTPEAMKGRICIQIYKE